MASQVKVVTKEDVVKMTVKEAEGFHWYLLPVDELECLSEQMKNHPALKRLIDEAIKYIQAKW